MMAQFWFGIMSDAARKHSSRKQDVGLFLLNPIIFLLMHSLNSFGSQVEIRSLCSWNISTVKAKSDLSNLGVIFHEHNEINLFVVIKSRTKRLWFVPP